MSLRSRATIAVLSALLSMGCSTNRSESAMPPVSIAPAPTIKLLYPSASDPARALASSFLTITLEYDAAKTDRLDFLEAAVHLATPAEVRRLRNSSRARLPWRVLRVREERTELRIDGITQTASVNSGVRVLVRLTVATHTDFATVHTADQVTLTLVPTPAGWKVDHARGGGL